jgi:hypothetical protein
MHCREGLWQCHAAGEMRGRDACLHGCSVGAVHAQVERAVQEEGNQVGLRTTARARRITKCVRSHAGTELGCSMFVAVGKGCPRHAVDLRQGRAPLT